MANPPSPSYLFTFSPKGTTLNATYAYMDHINTYFFSWHKCMSHFEVNPELNSNGNLHYHGYFIIKDKVKWFKVVLPKMKYNGNMKITKVDNDLSKALEYSRKDRVMMESIIDHKIPFTEQDRVKHIPPPCSSNEITNYFPLNKK